MKPNARSRRMIQALLGEYRLVVKDLERHVKGLTQQELVKVVDRKTKDPNCVSIQSILTHVVYCGRNYLRMIDVHRGNADSPKPRRVQLSNATKYRVALDAMMADTEAYFESVEESEMVRYDPRKKMKASWGQIFDIEQLLEHAIVHVSRHRRQVQRFKKLLRGEA